MERIRDDNIYMVRVHSAFHRWILSPSSSAMSSMMEACNASSILESLSPRISWRVKKPTRGVLESFKRLRYGMRRRLRNYSTRTYIPFVVNAKDLGSTGKTFMCFASSVVKTRPRCRTDTDGAICVIPTAS